MRAIRSMEEDLKHEKSLESLIQDKDKVDRTAFQDNYFQGTPVKWPPNGTIRINGKKYRLSTEDEDREGDNEEVVGEEGGSEGRVNASLLNDDEVGLEESLLPTKEALKSVIDFLINATKKGKSVERSQ